MKLANRVSSFFLIALAILLLGNSLLLYGMARFYLYRRFDEQLQSALNTLVAAVEVEDDDVKWEPTDHTVKLGQESGVADTRWLVFNQDEQVVARSYNLPAQIEGTVMLVISSGQERESGHRADWRMLQRSLAAPHPKPVSARTPLEHARLTVVVARNGSDVGTPLTWLAGALVLLPAVCWLVAALVGRRFCEQALAPLRAMVGNVSRIKPADTQARLPVPLSGDELEALGNAFNRLLDQVFLGYERQRRFAGNAAHQLRTPLTILQGHVEVALRRPRSAGEYEATLKIVNQEVSSLCQTVEALLLLARNEQEEAGPDVQGVDVEAWLIAYLEKWKSNERWEDISMSVEQGLWCETSPILLSQVLDVLISNALKYSQSGSAVTLRAHRQDDDLVMEVADRGMGIAAEDLDSLFVPFFRGREARQSGAAGTGLGLAIARQIAGSLGGSLECASELGTGSRFTLRVPIRLDARGAD
jgi:signal transduction histidine kinase